MANERLWKLCLVYILLSLCNSAWGRPGSLTGDMYFDLRSELNKLGPEPSGRLSSGDSILPGPFLVNKSPPEKKKKKVVILTEQFNSFPACGDFCRLLITFANSLDPDQAWQNVGPDLDPNCLTLWLYCWKIFLKKLILKRNPHATKTCKTSLQWKRSWMTERDKSCKLDKKRQLL